VVLSELFDQMHDEVSNGLRAMAERDYARALYSWGDAQHTLGLIAGVNQERTGSTRFPSDVSDTPQRAEAFDDLGFQLEEVLGR
jgi:hypothetical protein